MKSIKLFEHQKEIIHQKNFKRTEAGQGWIKRFLYISISLFFLMVGTMFLPWQQTSSGKGRVIASSPNERPQVISAPISGRLENWYVLDGQYVKKGERLARLADLDQKIITRLEEQIQASKNKVKASNILIQTAKKNVVRNRELLKEGLVSKREFEKSNQEYAQALIDAASAESELAKMEVSLSRQLSQEIVSPLDGYVISLKNSMGSALVKAGAELAMIVPETDSRVTELLLDGNDLPLVQIGQPVRLQFEGWPAVQFSGAPELAIGTYSGKIAAIDPYDRGNGRFRVLVQEDPSREDGKWPPSFQLRQGARAKGWVLLSVVSVGFEIWRRMNGFPVERQLAYQNEIENQKQKQKDDANQK